MTKKVYLVIGADQRARVVARLPNLRVDEVAYLLVLNFPAGWGSVLGSIAVDMPAAPTSELGGQVEPPSPADGDES